MFILPLMMLPSSLWLTNSPLYSSHISCFSCIQWLLPHILSQYVAHSCFCLKTVQLINWLVCGHNKNHDSRWTMHLLLLNISNDTSSSFVLIGTLRDFSTETLVYRHHSQVTFVNIWKFLCSLSKSDQSNHTF